MREDLFINGIPDNVPENISAVYRSKILTQTSNFIEKNNLESLKITISTASCNHQKNNNFKEDEDISIKINNNRKKNTDNDEVTIEERSHRYQSSVPSHTFEKLFFPEDLQGKLDFEIESIKALSIVYDNLNYKVIKPTSRRGLILAGEPGTGKTALAHAIANKLEMPILTVTYADIASKFHGEASQNLKAVFFAAHRDNALLHIEEADSFCSQRLAEISSSSDQAINSLRNQLFSCLDTYPVLTICTTNFVESFDKALETRLRYINIPMPDEKTRREIWCKCLHLPGKIQLASNVSIDELAKVEDVCGREIADAVEDAALKAVLKALKESKTVINKIILEQNILLSAIKDAKDRRYANNKSRKLTPEEKEEVSKEIQAALVKKEP
ncbi:ATP-binding protein [Brasilonema sp. UFV-L1]|uniref:ATP-binding protein n=1 Tax=Brasilonema sp. UFV-L1 TaxID=2234130 RepID=UPI00145E04C2|nr:ATP-binding protein [Brasilonema sp. UFV-L1]NMG09503.1 ATP-binding protein [Brasilonema sp. UFV-L1]